MTNRTDVLERLRSANPLPDLDAIDPTELADLRTMVDERRTAADRLPAVAAPSRAPKVPGLGRRSGRRGRAGAHRRRRLAADPARLR